MDKIDTSTAAIAKLLDGVTPGPWRVDGPSWNQIIWSSHDNRVCFMAHSNGMDVDRDLAAASFIAAARALVPALMAERDDLRAKLDAAVKALEKLHHAVCGETGFAQCVRDDSRTAYPWPALDEADELARAVLAKIKGADK